MKKPSQNQEVNLIKSIETISKKSAKTQLQDEKLAPINTDVSILSEYLRLSATQTILFATIVDHSLTSRTNFETLSRHFRITPLSTMSLMDDIEVLVRRGLIRKNIRSRDKEFTYNDIYYRVPNHIIDGIRKRDHSIVEKKVKFDLPTLLEKISNLSEETENKLISTNQMIEDAQELLVANSDLEYINYLSKTITKPINRCIAAILTYEHITGSPEVELAEFSEDVFDNVGDQFKFNKSISQGNHELLSKDLIHSYKNDFGYIILRLSANAAKKLYGETDGLKIQDVQGGKLIKPNTIKTKKLFFSRELQQEIDTLYKALSVRKYNNLRRELSNRNFNTGLTVLFYGASGVGKTELTYQLAKKSNREIMMVDLSETKSKWFGESEKLVKRVFDDYRLVQTGAKRCPILMINEVDGLISKRMSLDDTSLSTSQVQNRIQNIILQELEDFEGILIATTNLTENLDKAFDRRFLFKVNFTNPDAKARHQIWRSRLPDLPYAWTQDLSNQFALTGGQIENIVKKALINQVLGNVDILSSLQKLCSEELGYKKRMSIGFK